MAFAFEHDDADFNAVADGLFIPQTDLPGVTAAELAAGGTAWQSHFLSGFLLALLAAVPSPNTLLGVNLVQGAIAAGTATTFTKAFSFTETFYANNIAGTNVVIPVPSAGANNGIGGLNLDDVFPNAAKVAAAGASGAAGVLIPSSLITALGGPSHAALDVAADSRQYLFALMRYLQVNAPVRSTTEASAVTAAAVGAAAVAAPNAAQTAATNPTTGIPASAIPYSALLTRTVTYTLQYVTDISAETTLLNIVTA